MFGFTKVKKELDKDIIVNTKIGDLSLEDLVNEVETAHAKIEEQAAKITELEARNAELEAAKVEVVVEPVFAETKEEIQPSAEAAASVATDAEFKKDLNNALSDEPKTIVVQVPNIK